MKIILPPLMSLEGGRKKVTTFPLLVSLEGGKVYHQTGVPLVYISLGQVPGHHIAPESRQSLIGPVNYVPRIINALNAWAMVTPIGFVHLNNGGNKPLMKRVEKQGTPLFNSLMGDPFLTLCLLKPMNMCIPGIVTMWH